jgi:hypothetical protein
MATQPTVMHAPKPALNEVCVIFAELGFQITKRTKKILEFGRGPEKDAVYLKSDLASTLPIHIVLYPGREYSRLAGLPGVHVPPGKRYRNSNMGRFPKAKNKGQNEIHYGFPVIVDSMAALYTVLAAKV